MSNFVKNAVIVVLAALTLYFFFSSRWKVSHEVRTEYKTIEIPREIERIKKVEVPVEKVRVIPKEKIKYKYIPQVVRDDQNKEVVAIGTEKCPDETKVLVVSSIDKKTGDVSIHTKLEPRPIFKPFPGGEIGIKYEMRFNEDFGIGRGITAYGRYDIFRIKDVYLGVGAEIGAENKIFVYGRIEF
ncbi:MAG: hypothetical protein ABIM30_00190 [candidate division WOR-3 bacterium]